MIILSIRCFSALAKILVLTHLVRIQTTPGPLRTAEHAKVAVVIVGGWRTMTSSTICGSVKKNKLQQHSISQPAFQVFAQNFVLGEQLFGECHAILNFFDVDLGAPLHHGLLDRCIPWYR